MNGGREGWGLAFELAVEGVERKKMKIGKDKFSLKSGSYHQRPTWM